jgi:hypothetical protein
LEADGTNPPCWMGMAAPETGLTEISLPPWVVPTTAEVAPENTGVMVTLVAP